MGPGPKFTDKEGVNCFISLWKKERKKEGKKESSMVIETKDVIGWFKL